MVPSHPTPGNHSLPHFIAVRGELGTAEVARDLQAAVTTLLATPLARWPSLGLTVVKQRSVRTVLAGTLGGTAVHVKVYRADSFADRARDLLRGAPGTREADHLQRARSLGLPAVEPLGHGVVQDDGQRRSFVVTRSVAATPFAFATATAPVLERAGALLRTLHDHGLQPGDLHPGNLLVDDRGALHLLDFASLRQRGETTLHERARALAFFCQELDGGALDPKARVLLQGYLAAGADLPASLRDELAAATRRWRANALPAFGRRAERDCAHTRLGVVRRGVPRWYWHRDADGAQPALEAFFATSPTPHKHGRRGAVWLLPDLVVKQRPAGAARALWRAAYWLQFARVATPRPLAFRSHVGIGHVASERLPSPSLADELARGALAGAALHEAARSLGRQIGRLHAHGLGNRDLKLDNLVRRPGDREVCMVDLDGVRRRAATETCGRGNDLGRLLASFRAAGTHDDHACLRAFVRAYRRAHRDLLQRPPLRRLFTQAERRAGEWASAHRTAAR